MFSALEVWYENALYKLTFDNHIDIDIRYMCHKGQLLVVVHRPGYSQVTSSQPVASVYFNINMTMHYAVMYTRTSFNNKTLVIIILRGSFDK